MATFIYLIKPKEPNKQGKFQIYLQLTRHSKTLLIGMKQTIEMENWMVKNHRGVVSYTNSTRLNNLLLNRISNATDLVIDWDKQNIKYSAKEVKQALVKLWGLEKLKDQKPDPTPITKQNNSNNPITFFDFAKLHVKILRDEGKYNVSSESAKLKHFQEYLLTVDIEKWQIANSKEPIPELENIDIAFKDITVTLLKSYRAYLNITLKVGKKEENQKSVKERTIVNHLIAIRTIYNQGINNGAATRNDYPFGRGKISIKIPPSLKIGLNEEDVKKLQAFASSIPAIKDFSFIRERKTHSGLNQRLTAMKKKDPDAELNDEDKAKLAQVELWKDQYLKHAVNVWLVSFYFAGMRISDTLSLKWSDFQNRRLYYTMGKNKKPGSLKTPAKILTILEQYECDEQKHDLIFPELKVLDSLDDKYKIKLKIANADGRIHGALKIVAARNGIKKRVSPHDSRHAFGNIAGDQISIQKLQQLYRHSHITTTVNYQASFMHKDADEALDAVIDF